VYNTTVLVLVCELGVVWVDDWVKNGDGSPLKKYCHVVDFGDCCIVSSGTLYCFNFLLFLCPVY
jgi:hypothetical protein